METLKEFISELKSQEEYKSFISENPSSFICAGFFVIDLEEDNHKFQLDIFSPQKKKIAISEYPFERIILQEDKMDKAEPIENLRLAVDIPQLEEKIGELKEKNENKQKTAKIIAILKGNEWNLTCFSNTLELLRIHLNAETGECKKFEKVGLMEFVRVQKGK